MATAGAGEDAGDLPAGNTAVGRGCRLRVVLVFVPFWRVTLHWSLLGSLRLSESL